MLIIYFSRYLCIIAEKKKKRKRKKSTQISKRITYILFHERILKNTGKYTNVSIRTIMLKVNLSIIFSFKCRTFFVSKNWYFIYEKEKQTYFICNCTNIRFWKFHLRKFWICLWKIIYQTIFYFEVLVIWITASYRSEDVLFKNEICLSFNESIKCYSCKGYPFKPVKRVGYLMFNNEN